MRFYNLVISDPNSGQVWKPTSTGNGFTKSAGGSTFTSYVGGKTLPGALNIEFDFPVYTFDAFQGGQYIRIWGVGLGMIGQAANLNGANFSLSAGMKKGLPLANPAQSGLILQGTVFQAFGNWQGVNQTIDLICNPGAAGIGQNISWNWPAGSPLKSAIAATLTQAFPTFQQNINISSNLTLNNTQPGHYTTLSQFATYLLGITQTIGRQALGSSYPGVQISILGNTIYVYDGTVPKNTVNLAFQDLIGQPTWLAPTEISFKTVLRADIGVGSLVKLPPGIQSPYALTSQAAAVPNAPASSKTVFQGNFFIRQMHHWGNFRQPDADSWSTAFVAVPINFSS
jgi:hypothetical protein